MKRVSVFIIFVFLFWGANANSKMTNAERNLIGKGNANEPMRVLTIDNEPDSLLLRSKCKDVDLANDSLELHLFIERLKATMQQAKGVGIAAPQVGLLRNVFLFVRMDKEHNPVQVAINPRIEAYSEETFCFERDGCLSIPGISGNSIRYKWIDVVYRDETGKYIRERLSGTSRQSDFTGIIFQHEFDHLQGVLFIDKLCDLEANRE
jgi:peptide deformylase